MLGEVIFASGFLLGIKNAALRIVITPANMYKYGFIKRELYNSSKITIYHAYKNTAYAIDTNNIINCNIDSDGLSGEKLSGVKLAEMRLLTNTVSYPTQYDIEPADFAIATDDEKKLFTIPYTIIKKKEFSSSENAIYVDLKRDMAYMRFRDAINRTYGYGMPLLLTSVGGFVSYLV